MPVVEAVVAGVSQSIDRVWIGSRAEVGGRMRVIAVVAGPAHLDHDPETELVVAPPVTLR